MTAKSHLEHTFEDSERTHRDLMEPYTCRLAEALTSDERIAIMEMGLRETFKRRHPMPAGGCWPDGSILDGTVWPQEVAAP